jgi:hypothetical protein
MMPKSVKRFSGDIMLYLFDLEPDSDSRSNRPEIIRLWANGRKSFRTTKNRPLAAGSI